MTTSVSDLLEFGSLRDLLARFVHSALGRDELQRVEPQSDRAWIEETLAVTTEAMDYVRSTYEPQAAQRGAAIRPHFDSIPDIGPAAAMLRIEGAILETHQLYELAQMLDQASEIRSVIEGAA